MLLAPLGLITPLLAIGGMILSSFAILLSTLRIRAVRFERDQTIEASPLAEVAFAGANMVCEGARRASAQRSRPFPASVRGRSPERTW